MHAGARHGGRGHARMQAPGHAGPRYARAGASGAIKALLRLCYEGAVKALLRLCYEGAVNALLRLCDAGTAVEETGELVV